MIDSCWDLINVDQTFTCHWLRVIPIQNKTFSRAHLISSETGRKFGHMALSHVIRSANQMLVGRKWQASYWNGRGVSNEMKTRKRDMLSPTRLTSCFPAQISYSLQSVSSLQGNLWNLLSGSGFFQAWAARYDTIFTLNVCHSGARPYFCLPAPDWSIDCGAWIEVGKCRKKSVKVGVKRAIATSPIQYGDTR